MSARGTKTVRLRDHFSMLLLCEGTPLEASGGIHRVETRDPRMLRWVENMACTRGGGAKVKYEAPFFHWLNDQIHLIEDYAYAGTDF